MKSPSHYDGKTVGTPTDVKSAFHAGVVVGPDQIERMEQARKLRNRALKAARKAEREARYAAIPEAERERLWLEYKNRRKRADKMIRAMRNGTPVANVAQYYGLTPDDVLNEVKWLSEKRGAPIPAHPKQAMSKNRRRKLRRRARQQASREANARREAPTAAPRGEE